MHPLITYNKYVCIDTYTYVLNCIRMHTHIKIHTHTHTHIYIYIYIYIYNR